MNIYITLVLMKLLSFYSAMINIRLEEDIYIPSYFRNHKSHEKMFEWILFSWTTLECPGNKNIQKWHVQLEEVGTYNPYMYNNTAHSVCENYFKFRINKSTNRIIQNIALQSVYKYAHFIISTLSIFINFLFSVAIRKEWKPFPHSVNNLFIHSPYLSSTLRLVKS